MNRIQRTMTVLYTRRSEVLEPSKLIKLTEKKYYLCAAADLGIRQLNDNIFWGEDAAKFANPSQIPVLDHSGEEAAHFLKERPVSSTEYRCNDISSRLTSAYDEESWTKLAQSIKDRSLDMNNAGCEHIAINLSLNGLFLSALSPRKASSFSRKYVLKIIKALSETFQEVDVLLTWEEQVPFGISPSDGIILLKELSLLGIKTFFVKAEALFMEPLPEVEITSFNWLKSLVNHELRIELMTTNHETLKILLENQQKPMYLCLD